MKFYMTGLLMISLLLVSCSNADEVTHLQLEFPGTVKTNCVPILVGKMMMMACTVMPEESK